jgi:protein-ribulosamine 3-kinase
VPQRLSTGVTGGEAFLEMEHLQLSSGGDYRALARMLAGVHRTTGLRYGWHRDNFIGPTPQQNGWCDDWAEFWQERRLRPQLDLARRNRFDLQAPSPQKLLSSHRPAASLLHGDLWRGNAGFSGGRPVIFDPAVYCGDREADIAMTELFGGFPAEFYAAYHEAYPLPAEYQERKHLYNLYHLLNHLNIFGGSYLGQVQATLGLLRSAL